MGHFRLFNNLHMHITNGSADAALIGLMLHYIVVTVILSALELTCPDEVADVIANNDCTGGGMARAEAFPAINLPCGAVPIHCHS